MFKSPAVEKKFLLLMEERSTMKVLTRHCSVENVAVDRLLTSGESGVFKEVGARLKPRPGV